MMPNNLCCHNFPACQSPISCNPALNPYYEYWDKFVQEWLDYVINNTLSTNNQWNSHIINNGKYYNLSQWKYPGFNNSVPKNNPNDPTIQYLPEPWWGNNGTHPLSAVVINLNPGLGGIKQNYQNFSRSLQYSRYVSLQVDNFINNRESKIYINNKYQMSTTEWLLIRRALPIFVAFPNLPQSVENVLGIDLIPWHSIKTTLADSYINKNINIIWEKSIKFALEASEMIIEPNLRNVVFARISPDRLNKILTSGNIPNSNNVNINRKLNNVNEEVFEINASGKIYHIVAFNSNFNKFPSTKKIQNIVTNNIP